MRKINIILIIYLYTLVSCSDIEFKINETVSYINAAIKENSCRCRDEWTNEWNCINVLSVSENGLAKIEYVQDYISNKISKNTYFYLKNVEVTLIRIENDCYSIVISCKNDEHCLICNNLYDGSSENLQNLADIRINNGVVATRLIEAIENLLELSEKNKNFLIKDPYDK